MAPWWDTAVGEVEHWNLMASVCVRRKVVASPACMRSRGNCTYNMMTVYALYVSLIGSIVDRIGVKFGQMKMSRYLVVGGAAGYRRWRWLKDERHSRSESKVEGAVCRKCGNIGPWCRNDRRDVGRVIDLPSSTLKCEAGRGQPRSI